MAYELRVSERARSLRVTVYPDGEVRVTVPRRFSARAIERFLEQHDAWIERQVARAAERTVIRAERARIAEYKVRAKRLADERVAVFARRYGVHINKVTIRAQKSRWGSCSRAGNLSFNYKIALIPSHLAEYIVVHEICHRRVFDHSHAFWIEVARAVPDHRERRRELRSLAFRFD